MTKNTAAFHISGTMSFMIHLCKMMISPEVFYFFEILIGLKGKKWPKMTKNYVCHTLYIRKNTSYDCDIWYSCVKYDISRCFCHFFKIWILWVVSGVKGENMTQNDKKYLTPYHRGHTSYDCGFWYTRVK